MARRRRKDGIDWNVKGFEELRNTPKVRRAVLDIAREMHQSLGGDEAGYKLTSLVLEENRAAASILATGRAHFHNKRNHTLLKELLRREQ